MDNEKQSQHASFLDVMLEKGDLQLICEDGGILVHGTILALASPEVLAGAVEAAAGTEKKVNYACTAADIMPWCT